MLLDYRTPGPGSVTPSVHEAAQASFAQIEHFYQARKSLEGAARRKTKKAGDVSLSGAPAGMGPLADD